MYMFENKYRLFTYVCIFNVPIDLFINLMIGKNMYMSIALYIYISISKRVNVNNGIYIYI